MPPIMSCQIDGKPGFKYGDQGKCYPFDSDSPESKVAARKKAAAQGVAIEIRRGRIKVKPKE